MKKMKMSEMGKPSNLLILAATYVFALAILKFGDMNPLVVALMPCLALSLSIITRR
jgi:hypothetical protein